MTKPQPDNIAELIQAVLDSSKPSQASLDRNYELAMERKQTQAAEVLKKAGAREPAPAVAVDTKILESYVGTYKGDMGEIKFLVRDGKLFAQPMGGPELAMKAVAPTKFLIPQAQLEIEFDSPDGFTLKQGAGVMKFKKAGVQ